MQRLFASLNASLNAWVIDHWYGRLSLGESFWINCFFVNLGAGIIVRRFTPASGGLILLGVVSLVVSLWQLVGLWRSARRNSERQAFWSTIVRGLCIINVIGFVFITLATVFGGFGLIENMPQNILQNTPSGIMPESPSESPADLPSEQPLELPKEMPVELEPSSPL